MKLAVLSDIHGNLPAFSAVIEDLESWQPDHVIINGDVVNRGPYSLDALKMMDRYLPDATRIRGNHETFILSFHDNTQQMDDPLFDLKKFTYWSYKQLGDRVDELTNWQDHLDYSTSAGDIHVTHASMISNRRGVLPESSDEELLERLSNEHALYIVSHTHRPFIRTINDVVYVNTGSVGQPFDKDPRSSYGRFYVTSTGWQGEIRRVSYDKAQAERDFRESGFLDEAGLIPQIIYRELRHSSVFLGPWMSRFYPAMESGELSVADAVKQYLDEID